jgi:hypothetical protein
MSLHSYQDWKLENCGNGMLWWWHPAIIPWHTLLSLLINTLPCQQICWCGMLFKAHDTTMTFPTETDCSPYRWVADISINFVNKKLKWCNSPLQSRQCILWKPTLCANYENSNHSCWIYIQWPDRKVRTIYTKPLASPLLVDVFLQ